MTHNSRCANSKRKICKCSCNGALHGSKIESYHESQSTLLVNETYGGEIEQFINSVKDKILICSCGKKLECNGFETYGTHEGGLKDKNGVSWWIHLTCDKCGYDWASWKIAKRAKYENMSLEQFV